MDELTRAAQQLVDRPELTPPPITSVEARAGRYRHRVRFRLAVASITVVVSIAIVAAVVASDPGRKQNVIVGQPSTTPPTTTRPVPLQHTSYRAGDFDVTEYSFRVDPVHGPTELTLTAGAVWVGTGNQLVRVDTATEAITNVVALGGDIGALTSTLHTVYVLTYPSGDVGTGPIRVTAINADTLLERWGATVAPGQPQNVFMALGRNALWIARPAAQHTGELVSVDPTNGRVTSTTRLVVQPSQGIVASAKSVWVGADPMGVRIDLGPSGQMTMAPLEFQIRPLAADATSMWGLQDSSERKDGVSHLLRLSANGTLLADLTYAATGLAFNGRAAWMTASPGVIAILDPSTPQVVASGNAHTLMNQGPSNIHVLDGVGWALNTYSNQLVRITRR